MTQSGDETVLLGGGWSVLTADSLCEAVPADLGLWRAE